MRRDKSIMIHLPIKNSMDNGMYKKKNELRDLNDSITHKIPTILQPASQVMYDMMIVLEQINLG